MDGCCEGTIGNDDESSNEGGRCEEVEFDKTKVPLRVQDQGRGRHLYLQDNKDACNYSRAPPERDKWKHALSVRGFGAWQDAELRESSIMMTMNLKCGWRTCMM